MFEHLFREGRIGRMAVKNRLMMAPMVLNYAEADGSVNRRYEAHIERVARGGVGAMTLEASYVSAEGRGFAHQLGIHEDRLVPGLRKLVNAAHRHDAKIGIQLYHAGRQTTAAVIGQKPVSPSGIPCPLLEEETSALTPEEIGAIVGKFADSATRAVRAGFDYVEIHGAHGYLITQFLSGFSNHRDDLYGGSPERRMRFLLEVFAAVRDRVGPNFPIIVRLSGEELTPGGLAMADTVRISRTLEDWGADAIHVSACSYGSYATGMMISPMAIPDAPLARLAEQVRAAVSIPVIAADKIRSPELAEELIAHGVANFVALARPLLADPDWPEKARTGRLAAINKCIACNQGCISRLFAHKDAWCLANAETGREDEFAAGPAGEPRRVAVVGGGPGGMSAAHWARRAGHEVVLYERAPRLGGQLFAAGAAPHRPGWDELRRRMAWSMAADGVTVRTGHAVTASELAGSGADVVILATGARPRPAPWSDGMRVVPAVEVLEGAAEVSGRVVVAGGGCSGAQTAEFLAEKACQVTVVELGEAIAEDAPLDDRALLLKRLGRIGVRLMTRTRIMGVRAGEVELETDAGRMSIAADAIVSCLGSNPNDDLKCELEKLGVTVLMAGDCLAPERVTEAILEGARAGFRLEQPERQA